MEKKEKIIRILYEAIDKTNELLPRGQKMEKKEDMPLFDKGGSLDSMGLINFVIAVEQSTEEVFGKAINLTVEIGNLKEYNWLRTVGVLAEYMGKLV